MSALVIRDNSRYARIIESLDVSGMSVNQVDKAEEKMIDKWNDLGDFDERYTINLEG